MLAELFIWDEFTLWDQDGLKLVCPWPRVPHSRLVVEVHRPLIPDGLISEVYSHAQTARLSVYRNELSLLLFLF